MLATLTAWVSFKAIVSLVSDRTLLPVALFAVIVCFLCFLVVIERWPPARLQTTVLCAIPTVLVLLIVPLYGTHTWLFYVTLLILVFASFAVRRYSPLLGTLALFGVMTINFSWLLNVTYSRMGWYVLATAVGIGSAVIWQFVVLPRSAGTMVVRVTKSLRNGTAEAILAVASVINQPSAQTLEELTRQLGQVRSSRRTIESHLAIVRPLSPDMRHLLSELRIAISNIDRGVNQMADSALALIAVSVPSEARNQIIEHAGKLGRYVLSEPDQLAGVKPDDEWQQLRHLLDRRPQQSSIDEWRLPASQLAIGGIQVAHASRTLLELDSRVLTIGSRPAAAVAPPQVPAKPVAAATSHAAATTPVLHPTMVFAIQATLAVGLAMLCSWALDLDHANWAFLAAFSVVAGSTGESMRRIVHRVAGTVAGGIAGITVSAAVPDASAVRPLLIACCVFLVVFLSASSYPLMVGALTAGLTLAYTGFGGSGMDILVGRSLDTMLGAVIGGVIVLTVLPIRIERRVVGALRVYLGAVEQLIGATTSQVTLGQADPELERLELAVTSAYDKLESQLPAVAFEFNPLAQARSPLTRVGTNLAALNASLDRLMVVAGDFQSDRMPDRAAKVVRMSADREELRIQAIKDHLEVLTGQSAHKPVTTQLRPDPVPDLGRGDAEAQSSGSNERAIKAMLAVQSMVESLADVIGLDRDPADRESSFQEPFSSASLLVTR